jgi:diguanylate cyclase (GGDEF)-like protein
MTRDTLLAEVVSNLERPVGLIRFTPPLETHYREAIAEERRRSLLFASMIGLAILVGFSLPRVLFTASQETLRGWYLVLAALFATIAFGMAVARKPRRHEILDRATMIEMVVLAILVCVLIRFDDPAATTGTMYCFVMIPIAASTLASLQFDQTLTVTVVADLIFLAAVATKPDLDPNLHIPALLLAIAGSLMALWGSWRNDRQHRALFLFLTRERLVSEISAEQNAALREMTEIDPLTGIPNRRAFEIHFDTIRAQAPDAPLAVMMIDIDRFKAFNDAHGHLEGDRALVAVARALAGELRGDGDLVARLGGEEFAVLAAGPDRHGAIALLERLRRAVEKLAIPHGTAGEPEAVVTVSIGCMVVEPHAATTRRAALERADRALYGAKHAGRNRWVLDESGPSSE